MANFEILEGNKAQLTLFVDAARFEEGIQQAYLKNRAKITMQGFRPGKVPRKMIEMRYGKEFFYDEAIDFVFSPVYAAAVLEHNLKVVSTPELTNMNVDDNGALTLVVNVILRPTPVVNNYKGLTYKPYSVEVTEEEILAEINKARDKNARITTVEGRAIENGDTAVIDFAGFIDEEAFDGGAGVDFELTIGSHTFIDTFEDQLIGKNVGESTDVFVRFPDDYRAEHLAGKEARFAVSIKEIKCKELPELNDDFAADVSEFDTLDAYKADVAKKISEQKQKEKENNEENQIMIKLLGELVCDVPAVMIENQIDAMINDMKSRIERQGIDFEMFMQYTGRDMQSLREQYRSEATTNVNLRLALEEVARMEGIEISDDEFDAEIERAVVMYGMDKETLLANLGNTEKENIKTDLKVQKAVKIVIDNAVAVEGEEAATASEE